MLKSPSVFFFQSHQVSQEFFPKPPPVDPLPEDVWLIQSDRAEVGREAFFCGRDYEYEIFRRAMKSLSCGRVGGGTLIFQGAPGAGKSALMQECMEAIQCHSTPEDPWVAVSLPPGSLASADDVIMYLVGAANKESQRLSRIDPNSTARKLNDLLHLGEKLYEELSERGIRIAGLSVGGKSGDANRPSSSTRAGQMFLRTAPLLENCRLAVFVDEAQNIPIENATQDVLDCLHRDTQGISLVTAFFGLSDTEAVLRQCGLSRLPDERTVDLEPLLLEDATNSLRRMLSTYYAGTDEEHAVWANALAELSQGWPQHVNRIGVAAGRVIRSNDGRLDLDLLEYALEAGAKRKNAYYARQLAATGLDSQLYKQLALAADQHPKGILSLKQLRRISARELGEAQVPFDKFLTRTLHFGLLAPVKNLPQHYRFPIPSMGEYLRSLPVD